MKIYPLVWFDGQITCLDETSPSIAAHTLHYGTGAFEGIRAYNTAHGTLIFRLADHMNRFVYSLSVFNKSIPWDGQQLCQATIELVRTTKAKNCYIRPIFYFDDGGLEIAPTYNQYHIAILIFELPESETIQSLRLCISPWQRINGSALPIDKKLTGFYINSLLAKLNAQQRGFDDAILLDIDNNIAETSIANIAFCVDNTLITPSRTNILPGITRDTVFKLSADIGITMQERPITIEDAHQAQACFIMGTLRGILPISSLESTAYDVHHPLLQRLIDNYQKLVQGDYTDSAWNQIV